MVRYFLCLSMAFIAATAAPDAAYSQDPVRSIRSLFGGGSSAAEWLDVKILLMQKRINAAQAALIQTANDHNRVTTELAKKRREAVAELRDRWLSLGALQRLPDGVLPVDKMVTPTGRYRYANGGMQMVPEMRTTYLFEVPNEGCLSIGMTGFEKHSTVGGGVEFVVKIGGDEEIVKSYCHEVSPEFQIEGKSHVMWRNLFADLDELNRIQRKEQGLQKRIQELQETLVTLAQERSRLEAERAKHGSTPRKGNHPANPSIIVPILPQDPRQLDELR